MEENKELTLVEKVEAEAKDCFRHGLNCSECVMTAFLNNFETGLPKEVVKLATGFGGGMGHTGEACGAVTGMYMAAGMIFGYNDPTNTEAKNNHYKLIKKLSDEFKKEFGYDVKDFTACAIILTTCAKAIEKTVGYW